MAEDGRESERENTGYRRDVSRLAALTILAVDLNDSLVCFAPVVIELTTSCPRTECFRDAVSCCLMFPGGLHTQGEFCFCFYGAFIKSWCGSLTGSAVVYKSLFDLVFTIYCTFIAHISHVFLMVSVSRG